MFMSKYQQYADADILQVLDRLSIPHESDSRTSHRLDCPLCGAKGKAVVWNNTLFLNCCQGNKRHSAIDLVMLRFSVDFQTAIGILSGRFAGLKPVAPTNSTEPAQTADKPPFDAEYWSNALRKAQTALRPTAEAGQYLLSRGLQPETWSAFGLGAGTRQGQPALFIPWYNQAGELVAGRYRLLKAPDKQSRYYWWKNSDVQGNLWGWHSHQGRDAVILVEGEINALSLYQVCGDWLDVLSTGSENYHLTKSNIRQIGRYTHVFGWADKPATIKGWAGKISSLIPISSNLVGGDANDLLMSNWLADMLTALAG